MKCHLAICEGSGRRRMAGDQAAHQHCGSEPLVPSSARKLYAYVSVNVAVTLQANQAAPKGSVLKAVHARLRACAGWEPYSRLSANHFM
jgi:hypothetical protein